MRVPQEYVNLHCTHITPKTHSSHAAQSSRGRRICANSSGGGPGRSSLTAPRLGAPGGPHTVALGQEIGGESGGAGGAVGSNGHVYTQAYVRTAVGETGSDVGWQFLVPDTLNNMHVRSTSA